MMKVNVTDGEIIITMIIYDNDDDSNLSRLLKGGLRHISLDKLFQCVDES